MKVRVKTVDIISGLLDFKEDKELYKAGGMNSARKYLLRFASAFEIGALYSDYPEGEFIEVEAEEIK